MIQTYPRMKYKRRILIAAGAAALAACLAIVYAAQRIEQTSAPLVSADTEALPHKRVGLVLGCSPVLKSGQPNTFFQNRMQAAAAAFQAKKVDYLLVSGDNHSTTYDEPTAMRDALIKLGVPEDRIVLDYAGLSTLDSVVRAKKVFGLSEFCIITQRDHALRALYIARANGIEAVAFPAKDVRPARHAHPHPRVARPRPHPAGRAPARTAAAFPRAEDRDRPECLGRR